MITVYILEKCKYCKDILKYLKKNPTQNVCLIMISKDDLQNIYESEPRITQFPMAFTGTPKTNGLPYKNSHSISGSSTILQTLQNNFGKIKRISKTTKSKYGNNKLTGNAIEINYLNNNQGNINSLNDIKKHRNNCFGTECHVMDRPFGSTDNQFILQGYQTKCANPKRTGLPVHFGMTTPGTDAWKMERKPWPEPQILINDRNCEQNLLGNIYTNINAPMTYSNDIINRQIYNPNELAKYGNNYVNNSFGNKQNRFISGPVNSNYPFLTYGAGSNTISRVSGKNYLPEQQPIENPHKNAYLSGNLKEYAMKNANEQKLLSGGFSFGKKTNKYGNELVQTAFNSSQGDSGVAQMWKPNPFPNNGNNYGKSKINNKKKNFSSKSSSKSSCKPSCKSSKTSVRTRRTRRTKFTSPLGIEISFD